MPAKQHIPIKNHTNRTHQELTPTEKKLLECARNRQPVLLYGKDAEGRKDLVFRIHKKAIGLDERKKLEIGEELQKNVSLTVIKSHIRSQTLQLYFNCGAMDSKVIYEMVSNALLSFTKPYLLDGVEIIDPLPEDNLLNLDLDNLKRVLFFDNLYCNDMSDADYSNLALNIEKYKKRAGKNKGIKNWIVFYTYALDNLPPYFREQFKDTEISLESEKKSEPIDILQDKTESEKPRYKWSTDDNKQKVYSNGKLIAKLPSRQFKIFDTLKRKVGKYVKRETLETCWDTKPNYESFVTDAIKELETTLKEGLGNEENVIERKKNGKVITAYKLLP